MNRTSGNSTGQLILDFHINRAWSKSFFFYDKDTDGVQTERDVTTDTWEFYIWAYAGARTKKVSLSFGLGISFPAYLANQILVELTADETKLEEGEYYYELYNATEQRSYLSQKCYFTFAGPSADANQADADVIVSASSVEVNLIAASLSSSGDFLEAPNNLSDVTDGQTSRQNIGAAPAVARIVSKSIDYSLVSADFDGGTIIELTGSTPRNFTLPNAATITFSGTGFYVGFRRRGSATLTILAQSGATISSTKTPSTDCTDPGLDSVFWATLESISGNNTWLLDNGRTSSITSGDVTTALGYTPEDVANKDTDGTAAANSDTKYMSQKAVRTYVAANATSTQAHLKTMEALGMTIPKMVTHGCTLALMSSAAQALADGTLKIVALDYLFTATTLTGFQVYQGAKGSYTGDNNNKIGLYTYSGGTLTLVKNTANDANLWQTIAGSNQILNVAFTGGTYSAAAGQYFVGLLYNNSSESTAPTIGNVPAWLNGNTSSQGFTNSAMLSGTLAAQTDLPSSIAMSSLTASTVKPFVMVY